MGIGGSIFLIAVGAILAFAVRGDPITWLNLHVVGVVFMLCGATGLALTISFWRTARRRRAAVTETTAETRHTSSR